MHCDARGCAIYETRPAPCRDFECGWRVLPIVPAALRPDTSGVLVAADQESVPGYRDMAAIKFIFMTDAAITNAQLLECLAGLVHARAPVFVAAPGPAGHHPLKALINPKIEQAVAQRDGQAIALTLGAVIAKLRLGPFEPA